MLALLAYLRIGRGTRSLHTEQSPELLQSFALRRAQLWLEKTLVYSRILAVGEKGI